MAKVFVFYYFSSFLTSVAHIISASVKACSKILYSAGRMLSSKIVYSAESSTGRIYPSL